MLARAWQLCVSGVTTLAAILAPSNSPALDLVEVVARAEKSVVRIDTDSGLGSGVIIAADGLILTNFHVIEGAKRASIVLRSGRKIDSSGYLAIDPTHDLSILKVERLDEGSPMKMATSLPKIGEKVATFGSPQGFSFTTSEGIVSAIRSGQELIGILGSGFRGNPDATWIQTTAAISPGNSGGPLVNMEAELVGINTMSYVGGQNLNFAVSLTDVKRLLTNSATVKVPIPLDQMPRHRAVPVAPTPGKRQKPSDFKLSLPTGRVFSFEVFTVSPTQFNRASSASKEGVVVINHPNGRPFAAARQQDGLLHGATIAQWENEEPMVYATYLNGKRHGVVETWNEAGKPVLYAQYAQNKRHGFSCFFESGEFRLLSEYKNDQCQWIQVMAGPDAVEGFSSRADAEKNKAARELLEKQDEVEAKLKANEVTFRKNVAESEKTYRRALASQLGPEKRARTSQRRKDKEAQNAAVHDALWQKFWGR